MTKVPTSSTFLPLPPDTIPANGSTRYATLRNAASPSVTPYKLNDMFTKENIVYADAYKYLKHKERNIIALSIQGSADDFEELPMNDPLDVETDGSMVLWNNRQFATRPDTFTKEGIKTRIIKSRYSNDDQIAIMLNKDNNEADTMYYQKMQEWREFAAFIAQKTI